MASKKALIVGVAGQDGSYLAESLLDKGYEVHGVVSAHAKHGIARIQHIASRIKIYECDATDGDGVAQIVAKVVPDELYHLAAIVNPLVNAETEYSTLHDNLVAAHYVLAAVRAHSPKTKVFLAGSSLIFGKPLVSPQDERTEIRPDTPYGISKAASFFLADMYRSAYGIFVCTGILYNHESPRRNQEFLPKKITRAAVEIKRGAMKELRLGNLDAVRDWGYAGDYVEAMWKMLQAEKPQDYVIGTGVPHTVRDILDIAFGEVGLDWKKYVVQDASLMRSPEKVPLIASPAKIKQGLQWEPTTGFKELIISMVRSDLGNT